jgi:hypothetical protein
MIGRHTHICWMNKNLGIKLGSKVFESLKDEKK